jgi:hypothetical protein
VQMVFADMRVSSCLMLVLLILLSVIAVCASQNHHYQGPTRRPQRLRASSEPPPTHRVRMNSPHRNMLFNQIFCLDHHPVLYLAGHDTLRMGLGHLLMMMVGVRPAGSPL